VNTLTAWFKSRSISSHWIAGLLIGAAGIISTDQQVQTFITGLFINHPAAAAQIIAVAGLILKYTPARSDAGVLAAARTINGSGNAPTAAEVDAATPKN
jgi:hypothetical protein